MPRPADRVDAEWDFDALTAEKRLEPIPVKLGGRTYHFRRDLTAQERSKASQLILAPGTDGDIDGAAILLSRPGEDGAYDTLSAAEFCSAAASLPHDVETEVWERVLVGVRLATRKADASGEDGGPGESTASSPAS